MKKTILIFCAVLILGWAGTADAQQCQEALKGVIARKNAAPSCNPATNEVGDRGEYATGMNVAENNMKCIPYTADCSGTLGYAYAYHSGTDAENVKVVVYSDAAAGGAPVVGDLKIAASAAMSSSTDAEWAQSSGKLGGSVTSGNPYWVCLVSDSTVWVNNIQTTGSVSIWLNTGSNYAAPPDNLDGTWGETTTNEVSVYVAIE